MRAAVDLLLFGDEAATPGARSSRWIRATTGPAATGTRGAGHRRPARSTPTGRADRGRPSAGCGSTTGASSSTRTVAASRFRRATPARSRAAPDATGRSMKSVVIDPAAYDWGGDRPLSRPFRDTVIYEAHVRGFTANPNSGVPRRGVARTPGSSSGSRTSSTSASRAVELLPVFQFDALAAPGGRPNYWGYQPVSYFAPHAAYSSRPGRGRRGRRVPRSRQGAARGRARGHPRRRLQPHRRDRRRRPDLLLTAASPTTSTTSSTRPTAATPTTAACGNTLNANAVGRAAADPRQPALLGRRRCTSTASGSTSPPCCHATRRRAARAAADPVGHRQRPGPGRHEAHRRGLGRRRAVPGRLVRGRPLGGVEWPLPRRRARRSCKGDPGRVAAVGQRLLGSPDVYARARPRAAEDGQLRHLPRRLHARGPGLATTPSTTRRTARRTATAATRTSAGTAASRARPTTRPSTQLRRRQIKNLLTLELARRRRPDADDGRRGAAQPARQQQRLLPGQRAELVRLERRRARTPACCGSRGAHRGTSARPGRCSTCRPT